jgi:GTP-binding protein EngB required for normal cell division
MDPTKIRQKFRRFRILVIGRANAGKTTILQRVCNSRDNPEIYNGAGKKIDSAVLTASRERGEHDIENEMVFQSNPGFVFHDSRGFEAGGESEFIKVKEFIAGRSKETKINNRLHAIWYCIPMDEASRSFTQAEIKFFSQCDTGSIPVIVLFTKFDALYDVEFRKLRQEGKPRKDAKELAPKRAEDSFAKGPQLKFLKDVPWPPKCHVCLPDMDKDDADCGLLIERTAGTLDDEVVERLFVSTQKTNLELCMKYAAERILGRFFDSADTIASEGHANIIGRLGAWFPHFWVLDDLDYLYDLDLDVYLDDVRYEVSFF